MATMTWLGERCEVLSIGPADSQGRRMQLKLRTGRGITVVPLELYYPLRAITEDTAWHPDTGNLVRTEEEIATAVAHAHETLRGSYDWQD